MNKEEIITEIVHLNSSENTIDFNNLNVSGYLDYSDDNKNPDIFDVKFNFGKDEFTKDIVINSFLDKGDYITIEFFAQRVAKNGRNEIITYKSDKLPHFLFHQCEDIPDSEISDYFNKEPYCNLTVELADRYGIVYQEITYRRLHFYELHKMKPDAEHLPAEYTITFKKHKKD